MPISTNVTLRWNPWNIGRRNTYWANNLRLYYFSSPLSHHSFYPSPSLIPFYSFLIPSHTLSCLPLPYSLYSFYLYILPLFSFLPLPYTLYSFYLYIPPLFSFLTLPYTLCSFYLYTPSLFLSYPSLPQPSFSFSSPPGRFLPPPNPFPCFYNFPFTVDLSTIIKICYEE